MYHNSVAQMMKLTFWEELDDVLQSIPGKEVVVIGDFNGHVGMERVDLER